MGFLLPEKYFTARRDHERAKQSGGSLPCGFGTRAMLRHTRRLGSDPLDQRAASRNVYFAVNKVGRGFVVVIVFETETSEFLKNPGSKGQILMAETDFKYDVFITTVELLWLTF